MNCWFLRGAIPALAFAAASISSTAASAAEVLFTLTGPHTATFTADVSPAPSSSTSASFILNDDVVGTLDGSPATYSYLEFWTSAASGGFTTSTTSSFLFDLTGPQLFTGSTSSPTFTLGTYTLANGYTLNIGAVPEPATWAMMLVGFGAIGISMRMRRPARTTVPHIA